MLRFDYNPGLDRGRKCEHTNYTTTTFKSQSKVPQVLTVMLHTPALTHTHTLAQAGTRYMICVHLDHIHERSTIFLFANVPMGMIRHLTFHRFASTHKRGKNII